MAKHKKTLQAVFEKPTRANLRWADIEAMLRSLGAEISEGSGSRVRVRLGNQRAVFHRPHPQPVAAKVQVESVRRFIERAGFQP
ncbi:MAG: type II toxin-antitoxin system HicA family toxin [Pirellulales bacterium]